MATTSIFAETIAKAISDYRQLLRRYLPQSVRVTKLSELKLKDPTLYDSDLTLFKVAHAIIADIEENMKVPDQGYYSYSGILMFCDYLKEYLDNYEIDGDQVVHRAQKASKALLQAIQLAMLPENRLNETIVQKFQQCNETIAQYGSKEQRQLHKNNLERQKSTNETFYASILENFRKYEIAAN